MSQNNPRPGTTNNGGLVDAVEGLATGVGRFGFGLLSFGLDLLPPQSRQHMYNALHELSRGFATLPRDFAEIAGVEIERWAGASDTAPTSAAVASAAPTSAAVASATPTSAAVASAAPAATSAPTKRRITPVAATEVAASSASPSLADVTLGTAPAEAPPRAPAAMASRVPVGIAISHIEYDPPGRDVDGEYVLITNRSSESVDLTGWTLSDGGDRHVFIFPAFTLASSSEVKVWTKGGSNNASDLYWGCRTAIWNNTGDTGTLKTAAGATVSIFAYEGKP